MMIQNEKIIWDFLYKELKNAYGVSGLMGNMQAESGLNSKNMQNSYEKKLNYTDDTYVAAVDNGTYTNFVKDQCGFGIVQWTYYTRKQNLLNYAKSQNKSIGDLTMQLEFLIKELKLNYSSVYNSLKAATSVKEASNTVLFKFEKPANQNITVQNKRASYSQNYYNKYATDAKTNEVTNMAVDYNKYINSSGTHYISNSGSDENKKYHGGKAGDQTSHEWELRSWYNRPWTHVFRYEKDPRVGETLCNLSCSAALNNKIGYDQYQRTTYWAQLQKVNYDPSKIEVACEEDCSAGTAANVKATGYLLGIKALQEVSSSMTSRNTVSQLTKAGFTALTKSKYLTSSKYLLPGDILLYENHHVAVNVTRGANASNITTISTPNLKGTGIGIATALMSMNIREEPQVNSKSYEIIPKGAKVEVLEIIDEWYKIVYSKSPTGCAYTSNRAGKYYSYFKNTISETKDEPTDKDTSLTGNYITTGSLNIRQGASTSNPIITTIPKGTEVYCDGSYSKYNNVKWLYITFTYNSTIFNGFASEKYLKSSNINYTVTGNSVNVRKEAGISSISLGTVKKGENIVYQGKSEIINGTEWILGSNGKLTGYISTKYLKKE